MGKRIHHMGMTLTHEEHERFHREACDLSPKQHDALIKRLGITKEQDEEWHRTHLTLGEQRDKGIKGLKAINPFAAGGGFLSWCVKQGWLVQQGKQYFATKEGARELHTRFDISVQHQPQPAVDLMIRIRIQLPGTISAYLTIQSQIDGEIPALVSDGHLAV